MPPHVKTEEENERKSFFVFITAIYMLENLNEDMVMNNRYPPLF
ncbi:hypothetical protein bcere0022_10560 [Bacillus cereus Rock3-44]|nr:hypothetical protein bcere0022_10560 [Bacillus cereus Rock3-44]